MTNMRIHLQRICVKNKMVLWAQATHIENQHEGLSIKHGPREEIRRTPPPPPRSRGPLSYTLDVVYPRLPWPTGDSKHPISSEQDFHLTPLCLISPSDISLCFQFPNALVRALHIRRLHAAICFCTPLRSPSYVLLCACVSVLFVHLLCAHDYCVCSYIRTQ